MTRATFLKGLAVCCIAPSALVGCRNGQSAPNAETRADTLHVAPVPPEARVVTGEVDTDALHIHPPVEAVGESRRTAEAWRELVGDDAYHILFEEGTEPRYSSPLLNEDRRGTFICAACHLPLFPSTTMYESGTGWPSYWAPLDGRLGTKRDTSAGMIRTEYHCARCGGHQGHVFEDGPAPTGLRYCNNGLALAFVPEDEPLPELR
ncbi:MAG: peptide-methionine (R)-S-oxide reductase MsrB [Longimonas sp.]|uniref:peptide-methionine (R)-S-oxide reductase MsrB n=1 Tax=Longimonas sp. TaxID=2039626 RepID=UPI00334B7F30